MNIIQPINIPIKNSDILEKTLLKEYNKKLKLIKYKYSLDTNSIIIPKLSLEEDGHSSPIRIVRFTDHNNPYKKAIYVSIVASYNYIFHNNTAPISSKIPISQHVPMFIEWLNDIEIKNPYKLLKEYEKYHFDKLNNHGNRSVLIPLKRILNYCLEHEEDMFFLLKKQQIDYLFELQDTPCSPQQNTIHESFHQYFGKLDWLRQDNIGIGHQLYQTLASPKLTIKSFKITISVVIIELHKYKTHLKEFLIKHKIISKNIKLIQLEKSLSKKSYNRHCSLFIAKIIKKILIEYYKIVDPHPNLTSGIKLFLLSFTKDSNTYKIISNLLYKKEDFAIFFDKKNISMTWSQGYFSYFSHLPLFTLTDLSQFNSNDKLIPKSNIESLLFSWLMASMTISPTDISKLTHYSFRLIREGGKVRHIESEYFKGRANKIHTTNSVSTKTLEGKALYNFLQTTPKGSNFSTHTNSPKISKHSHSLIGCLYEILNMDHIKNIIMRYHTQEDNLPPAIYKSIILLIKYSFTPDNIASRSKCDLVERKQMLSNSESPSSGYMFGLRAIKNSAVHAFSDPYTLEFLINRNSHSNTTEKKCYLNEDNEEWINSSGRITRNIMLDLINNVFDLSEVNKEKFNNEFSIVSNDISHRSSTMLARLKILTNKSNGKINEIGILTKNNNLNQDDISPIYIHDSPITVFKMLNYRSEAEKNCRKLLTQSPYFLYKTVLPTVEWIEQTLPKISKDSYKNGEKLYIKFIENNVKASVFHNL